MIRPALAFFIAFILTVCLHDCANARDLGQWEKSTPEQRAWYQSLVQPDSHVSCCGEGDAYWADEVHVVRDGTGNEQVVAVVTDDRDDESLSRAHVPVGTRYVVPDIKVVDSTKQHGNPTGHQIIFLGVVVWWNGTAEAEKRPVLCFIPGAGF